MKALIIAGVRCGDDEFGGLRHQTAASRYLDAANLVTTEEAMADLKPSPRGNPWLPDPSDKIGLDGTAFSDW
jgi:hypothetical protein